MFSHPHGVHWRQSRYLIGSTISSRKTMDLGFWNFAFALEGGAIQRGKKWFANSKLSESEQTWNKPGFQVNFVCMCDTIFKRKIQGFMCNNKSLIQIEDLEDLKTFCTIVIK